MSKNCFLKQFSNALEFLLKVSLFNRNEYFLWLKAKPKDKSGQKIQSSCEDADSLVDSTREWVNDKIVTKVK